MSCIFIHIFALLFGFFSNKNAKPSNGTRIPVDEKTDRPEYIDSPNVVLEIMSNPDSNYQTEGWAYHRGRYICYGTSNETQTGLVREPVFFFIDEKFINMFNRNSLYPARPISKITDGLYRSIIKLIPREDIRAFIRGDMQPPEPSKPMNKSLLEFGCEIEHERQNYG